MDDIGKRQLDSILARKRNLESRIKAMSTSEKLRLAADFLDSGQRGFALAVAKRAVVELEVSGG